MPKFRITNPLGLWDGKHRHAAGTIVQIEAKDYDRLLSRDMEPLDAQAKKDIEECRKRWAPKGADGKPLPLPEFYVPVSGSLNPHNMDDLRKLQGTGVTVVETAAEAQRVVTPNATA